MADTVISGPRIVEPAVTGGGSSESGFSEFDVRNRMIACLQQLVGDLSRDNAGLRRKLGRVRRESRAAWRALQLRPAGNEFESAMLATGSLALLNLPSLDPGEATAKYAGSAVVAPLSHPVAPSARIYVNHLRPATAWEPLSAQIRRVPAVRAARLAALSMDLVCWRFGESVLRRLPDSVRSSAWHAAGILVIDSDGVVRLANQRVAAMTDFPVDELLGRTWFQMLVPQEDWNLVRHGAGIRTRNQLESHEFWLRSRRGTVFPVLSFKELVGRDGTSKCRATVILTKGAGLPASGARRAGGGTPRGGTYNVG